MTNLGGKVIYIMWYVITGVEKLFVAYEEGDVSVFEG